MSSGLVLLFQAVLALFEAAFLLAQLAAGLFDLAVEFLALLEQLVLGLELGTFADGVGILLGAMGDLGDASLDAIQAEAIKEASSPEAEQQSDESGQRNVEYRLCRLHTGHSFSWPAGISDTVVTAACGVALGEPWVARALRRKRHRQAKTEMRSQATPTGPRRRAPSPSRFRESNESRGWPATRARRNSRPAATGLGLDRPARDGMGRLPAAPCKRPGRPVGRHRGGEPSPGVPGRTTVTKTGPCATRGCSGVVRRSSWLVLVLAMLPATPPRELPEKLRTSYQRLRSSTSARSWDPADGISFTGRIMGHRAGVRSTKNECRDQFRRAFLRHTRTRGRI